MTRREAILKALAASPKFLETEDGLIDFVRQTSGGAVPMADEVRSELRRMESAGECVSGRTGPTGRIWKLTEAGRRAWNDSRPAAAGKASPTAPAPAAYRPPYTARNSERWNR